MNSYEVKPLLNGVFMKETTECISQVIHVIEDFPPILSGLVLATGSLVTDLRKGDECIFPREKRNVYDMDDGEFLMVDVKHILGTIHPEE